MDRITQEAMEYIRALFDGNADGHGAAHTIRVWRNAMRIAEAEPACDRQVVSWPPCCMTRMTTSCSPRRTMPTPAGSWRNKVYRRRRPTGSAGPSTRSPSAKTGTGARIPRKAGSYRTRTGWTRSEPSGSPGPLPTAGSTAGRLKTPSGIFMKNCFC